MAKPFKFSTCYVAYIDNDPYNYPADNIDVVDHTATYRTGWQIIPGILWGHFASPKQWFHFVNKFEAYHVQSIEHTIFNMIPLTEQIAIQRTNTFTAFNSCVYAWGYKDELYETSWHNWYAGDEYKHFRNHKYKEGQICQVDTATKVRYELPVYTWNCPSTRTVSANTENYPHIF